MFKESGKMGKFDTFKCDKSLPPGGGEFSFLVSAYPVWDGEPGMPSNAMIDAHRYHFKGGQVSLPPTGETMPATIQVDPQHRSGAIVFDCTGFYIFPWSFPNIGEGLYVCSFAGRAVFGFEVSASADAELTLWGPFEFVTPLDPVLWTKNGPRTKGLPYLVSFKLGAYVRHRSVGVSPQFTLGSQSSSTSQGTSTSYGVSRSYQVSTPGKTTQTTTTKTDPSDSYDVKVKGSGVSDAVNKLCDHWYSWALEPEVCVVAKGIGYLTKDSEVDYHHEGTHSTTTTTSTTADPSTSSKGGSSYQKGSSTTSTTGYQTPSQAVPVGNIALVVTVLGSTLPPADFALLDSLFAIVTWKGQNPSDPRSGEGETKVTAGDPIANDLLKWRNNLDKPGDGHKVFSALGEGTLKLHVDGYASITGVQSQNQQYSADRVNNVVNYLKHSMLISSTTIIIPNGYGDKNAKPGPQLQQRVRARLPLEPRAMDRAVVVWLDEEQVKKLLGEVTPIGPRANGAPAGTYEDQ
jgi:hypothetical protein